MIGIRERIEKVAKAMFLAHHRYRFDLGISLPDAEQQRRFPATSIEQKERGDDPLETMWAALPWKEQLPFEYYAQAALRFLGCVQETGDYRCESCGVLVPENVGKVGSHAVVGIDAAGDPYPVECGPVSRVPGEVYCPEPGAVARAVEALARECEFCHEMHSLVKIGGQESAGRCGPGVCGVWDAKAALRGEGGET